MLTELLPFFASGGVSGAILLVGYMLHRDAVRTHEQRAADWRATAQDWKRIAEERERQISHIIGAVKETTTEAA